MKVKGKFWMVIFLVFVLTPFSALTDDLSPTEKQIVSEISISQTFGHTQKLVQLSPRLVGSGTSTDKAIGTDYDVAMYIKSQLESYGFKPWMEEFSIGSWILYDYKFVVDYDGDFSTTKDQYDMTKNVIPSRYRANWDAQTIDFDTMANIAFISSSDIGNVSGKIVFAEDSLESEDDHAVFNKIWNDNAVFNVTFKKGFAGIVEHRWGNTFSVSESDFLLIKSKATPSTKVHIVFKIEKKSTKAYNVVAMIPGEDKREIILTAHYDAPFNQGANDNGSGTAVLLETARVLTKYKFKHPVYFVFTDGEEQGLFGAYDYVNRHRNDILDAVVLNADCVGTGEIENLTVGINFILKEKTYSASRGIDDTIAEVARMITGYLPKPDTCEYACDDAFPFKEAGIDATTIASNDYTNIHSSLDTLSNMNKDFLFAVVKVMAVSIYRLAEGGGLAESQVPSPTAQAPQQQPTQPSTQTPALEQSPTISPLITTTEKIGVGLIVIVIISVILIGGAIVAVMRVRKKEIVRKPTASNKFCPRCGRENLLDSRFCMNCGNPLD